ncbi:MAG: hypothetical protein IKV89_03845 [Clostridia bacterium]|nr:hypothetical protein [Clostridia bacterium]
MTNKEKISRMNDKELLELLDSHGFCSSESKCNEQSDCEACIEKWLKAVI